MASRLKTLSLLALSIFAVSILAGCGDATGQTEQKSPEGVGKAGGEGAGKGAAAGAMAAPPGVKTGTP